MKSLSKFLRGSAIVSACLLAMPANAQDVKPDDSKDTLPDNDIIVTGSARAERRFDVSYAINSISQDDIKKIAPLSIADLIGTVPGFQVENTGGEIQNPNRIRGLPSDSAFVTYQQDGIPLFHESDGIFFRGDSLTRLDLMTESLEIVRGGPAPIYASYAGAILNNITVSGTDTSRGKAQLTLGDTGLYRLDAVQSGPIGKNTYYAIGGFIRQHDGYRDNGFPNDRGGQIRANLKHDFDNGSIKFTLHYVNDHNVFYLPIPIADPRKPSVSLDQYIDYFTGTMNSPAFRNVNLKYRDGGGVIQNRFSDLADGRHMQMVNVGVQYEGDFSDWLVSAKAGYTQGKLDFAAYYSTTNPVDGNEFAAKYLKSATAAFGSVASMGYTIAGTNTPYDPYSASGLVMSAQYRDIHSNFYSAQGDLSVTRAFETGIGKHDVKVGLYVSAYGETNFSIYQDYLNEIAGKPRTLDLVAYSGTGAVLGRVTDNGVLNYSSTIAQGDTDSSVYALYANDTWEIVPGLRIDAGIRHEEYSYTGWGALTDAFNLGDAKTLADNTSRGFTGAIVNRKYTPSVTNWTAGANYDFSHNFGVYVRASHLETPTSSQITMSTAASPLVITTKVGQYEAGIKLASGRSYLYLTGFYTNFDPLNASFIAFDPVTGQNDVSVPFVGKAKVKGVEIDGMWRATPWFSLTGALTISDPQYKDFQNTNGADPALVQNNQIVREPKTYGNIRPSFNFKAGTTEIEIDARYNYTGKRFVDLYNNTVLPAYSTIGAGISASRGSWSAQVVADNLTNAEGVTEGNTRTDNLAGQGSATVVYGRPVYGRNFRLVVTKAW